MRGWCTRVLPGMDRPGRIVSGLDTMLWWRREFFHPISSGFDINSAVS